MTKNQIKDTIMQTKAYLITYVITFKNISKFQNGRFKIKQEVCEILRFIRKKDQHDTEN